MNMNACLFVALVVVSCCGHAVASGRSTCSSGADVLKFPVGAMNATVFSDGVVQLDESLILIDSIATTRAYERWSLVPFQSDYHPVLFETGSKKVLIDTGSGPRGFGAPATGILVSEMRKAGYPPESIDEIILTHAHSDHIGGLVTEDGSAVFPNAKLYVPKAEFEFWSADPLVYPSPELNDPEYPQIVADDFLNNLKPYGERVSFHDENAEVLPGFTFVPTPGHTPGHVSVRVASGNSTVLVASDAFLGVPAVHNPEWRYRFDVEGGIAVTTKYNLFDELARTGELVVAYHLQFPVGRIVTNGAAYDWIPENI